MVLDHNKMEIDVANKDKKCKVFPEGFAIQAFFSEPDGEEKKKDKKPRAKSKGKKSKKDEKKDKPKKPKDAEVIEPVVISEESEPEPDSDEKIQPVDMGDDEPSEQSDEPQVNGKKSTNKRKSFYDYSDYGALQNQIELSDDSEGLSFSSSE